MNKIRTQTQLQDFLDSELGWRMKEIANMRTAVKDSGNISVSTMVRAGIALLYAHWEGFVKSAAIGYLNYVNCQGLRYRELQNCFVVFGMKKTINELVQSKKASVTIGAITFLREKLDDMAEMKIASAIDTESNLSSVVFHNILLSIGLDPSAYETRFNLIDVSLLERRNNIAHGEYLDIKVGEWANLTDEILSMLRQFKTDIENATTLSSYRK